MQQTNKQNMYNGSMYNVHCTYSHTYILWHERQYPWGPTRTNIFCLHKFPVLPNIVTDFCAIIPPPPMPKNLQLKDTLGTLSPFTFNLQTATAIKLQHKEATILFPHLFLFPAISTKKLGMNGQTPLERGGIKLKRKSTSSIIGRGLEN